MMMFRRERLSVESADEHNRTQRDEEQKDKTNTRAYIIVETLLVRTLMGCGKIEEDHGKNQKNEGKEETCMNASFLIC